VTRPTALIAEDEQPQRQQLCDFLADLWPELEVVAACGDGLAALEALAELQPQIVFLDIRMPGVSGLEVARSASTNAHVVFTTAYEEYALKAFEHGALDYLLKPIKRERISQTIARLKERLDTTPPDVTALIDALQQQLAGRSGGQPGIKWITGTLGNVTRMFAIDDVVFFQAQDKYTRVVTATDEVHIRTSLKELLAALDGDTFWQVHRSVIVRVAAIKSVERDPEARLQLRLKTRNDILPVSGAFQYRFRTM
jgi:DNA-binding LytR/AlgR family response regulator